MQAFAARLPPGAPGRVVLFTSGQHRGGMPGELPYVASKGALHQVTPSLAAHLAPRRVTVNCVDPGPTDTGYAHAALREAVAARHPAGRWGTSDDAARLVAWLSGDEAAWGHRTRDHIRRRLGHHGLSTPPDSPGQEVRVVPDDECGDGCSASGTPTGLCSVSDAKHCTATRPCHPLPGPWVRPGPYREQVIAEAVDVDGRRWTAPSVPPPGGPSTGAPSLGASSTGAPSTPGRC